MALPLTVDVCPALSIDGGSVSYSNDSRIEGTVATYRCDGNLVLVGNEMRICGPRSVNAGVSGEVGMSGSGSGLVNAGVSGEVGVSGSGSGLVDAGINGEVGVWNGSDPMCGHGKFAYYH